VKLIDPNNPVTSAWFVKEGHRLDAPPYLSGGVEARVALDKLRVPKQPLKELTRGYNGGIFNGPQFKRSYVDSSEYGVPFLGSASMLQSDLSNLPFISKKSAFSPKLSPLHVEEGMILISCSGTIGRMAYARPEMAGMLTSQHIMKIVPNPDVIPPGYLYAYLGSRFGKTLVTSGTYGAIIQHIEPEHIADLRVPRFGGEFESKVHDLIHKAGKLRSEANIILKNSRLMIEEYLKISNEKLQEVDAFGYSVMTVSQKGERIDALYNSYHAQKIEKNFANSEIEFVKLASVVERHFKPNIFKRLWVNDSLNGAVFVSGSDLVRNNLENPRFVSPRIPNFDDFLLSRGWIVFQAAGQISGIFGQPIYISNYLDQSFCADDVYRLIPRNPFDGGYLFSFLSTFAGKMLIKRQACGNSIPRIWQPHVEDIRIPWPDQDFRKEVGLLVIDAHIMRDEASVMEIEAIRLVENAIASNFVPHSS
jgi:type I restriction enzyme, S subunit